MSGNLYGANGATTVMQWRDGRQAAVGLAFDDSLWSHVRYVIPLLVRNGLAGSFWVNPARSQHGYGIEMWEGQAEKLGMELCAHTMNHIGADTLEQADYEIGECARMIRASRPAGANRFVLFLRGGGTTWQVTDEEIAALIKKHDLHRGRGDGIGHGGNDKTGEELVGHVKQAQADGEFHYIAFHGVGPHAEWLKTSAPAFEKLVDYLARNKNSVWNATCGEIHKYKIEQQSASVDVTKATEREIRVKLTCDQDPEFYDAALTLETRVPGAWKRCLVKQGKSEAVRRVKKRLVRYDAVPGKGEIVLTPTKRKLMVTVLTRPAYSPRRFSWTGDELFARAELTPGATAGHNLPSAAKDLCVGLTFTLSKDFYLPEYVDDGSHTLSLLRLADDKGEPLAAVNIFRQGEELCLYAVAQDNGGWEGLPGWPNFLDSHLQLKAGCEHEVLLRVREGYRDGGAELWLDGKLACSYMRRDTKGRKAQSLRFDAPTDVKGQRGTVRVARVKVTGR